MLSEITICGGVASNPTQRETTSGNRLTTFRIKESDGVTRPGADPRKLILDVEAFNADSFPLADHCLNLRQGDQVQVTGKLYTRLWKNHDGTSFPKPWLCASRVHVNVANLERT